MIAAEAPLPAPAPEEGLLRGEFASASQKAEYQELKFTLHHKLLDRINLDALSGIDNGEARGRCGPRCWPW